jgi:hypothetical protein
MFHKEFRRVKEYLLAEEQKEEKIADYFAYC